MTRTTTPGFAPRLLAALAGITPAPQAARASRPKALPQWNGRGDRLSPKRETRRRLCAAFGVTTGRQWIRLRKDVRRYQHQQASR